MILGLIAGGILRGEGKDRSSAGKVGLLIAIGLPLLLAGYGMGRAWGYPVVKRNLDARAGSCSAAGSAS
ncbi:MAG: hypothetical protein U0835_05590 [Isosphaeraceae bacterium]